jgi:hypothetical protein
VTDQRPVWLLDIDGVINAVSRDFPTHVWPEEVWQQKRIANASGNFPITWAQPVIDFLRDTHERGRAEIRWHTTWQHEAQLVADLTGLPEFPVAHAPEFNSGSADMAAWIAAGGRPGSSPWWKLAAALRVVQGEGRPLVWTDDDITDALWGFDMGAHFEAHAPTLAVCPDHRTGLIRRDLDIIDTFLHDLEMNR